MKNYFKFFLILLIMNTFLLVDTILTMDKLENEPIETSPIEDLMREHGIISRLLLIYEEIDRRIKNDRSFNQQLLFNAAEIVRKFVEDYHEKLEEDFIFPRLEKANKCTQLIKKLKQQHKLGSSLTDNIKLLSRSGFLDRKNRKSQKLSEYLNKYIKMYRAHHSREDTEIFTEFSKLISKSEYEKLGKTFEDKEEELFGENGFKKILNKVIDIEKALKINDIGQFTPQLN